MNLGARTLDSRADTLALAEASLLRQRRAEADILYAAAVWCDQHPAPPASPGRTNVHPCQLGGEGTPMVADLAATELAVSLRIHPLSCRNLMADALDLRHRLPGLWQLTVEDLALTDWVARRVARRTRHLPAEDALLIDRDLCRVAVSLPPSRLLDRLEALIILADARAAEEDRKRNLRTRFVTFNQTNEAGTKGLYAKLEASDAIIGDGQVHRLARILHDRDRALTDAELDSVDVYRARALGLMLRDPEAAARMIAGLDDPSAADEQSDPSPSRSAATTVVHVHVGEGSLDGQAATPDASGVARLEGEGPITLGALVDLLRHTRVHVRPVMDPREHAPADSYEFRGDLRDAVHTFTPADCYPYAVNTTRRVDLDHTIPYDPHGPPGQTRLGNAGPMVRHHHRIKTHGPISVRQPRTALYVWRTRHERYRVTDADGTHDVDPRLGKAVHDGSGGEQHFATRLLDVTFR